MKKITQEERNLFNPYKNVSFIFKKKLENKDNAYVGFNSEIRFDEESFSENNFEQAVEVHISNMANDPMGHRNSIHPIANKVMQDCKLTILYSGGLQSSAESPQSIYISKNVNGYGASLFAKVKGPMHLNAILLAMGQSTELSIKVDLLCDDSTFSRLEEERGFQAIVHAMSISFNLSGAMSN